MTDTDVIIIGAGIAGASAAYELARDSRVVVLEKEAQAGYHATGRSGAVFIEPYGNEVVQALTAASKAFMCRPPDGFCDAPLLTDRELFITGTADQADIVSGMAEMVRPLFPQLALVDGAELEARVPLMRKGIVTKALHDPSCKDIDADGLLQGFLRGAKACGAKVVLNTEVTALRRTDGRWRADTAAGEYVAPIVINAAGAWVERIAGLARVRPRGITPMRRSMYVLPPFADTPVRDWPLVGDVGETWYFKPESGRLMASPSEEDPMEPCDARPDQLVIAAGVERLQGVLDLEVRRIEQQWAGLRTFAADRSPVVGYDPGAEGFFWLGGQGGFGLQTAPAVARLVAALVAGRDVPADIAVAYDTVAPARLSA